MNIRERIAELRKYMNKRELDAWIVPSSDPHQSEYVADRWKGRAWISGFTGSAGIVVFTADKAGLWTDSRYFLQASEELEGSGIDLFKMGMPDVPSYNDWLLEQLGENNRVGFDPELFSASAVKNMKKKFASKKISIVMESDLLDLIWQERPTVPKNKIFLHTEEFAGETRGAKIERVREEMVKKGSDYHIVSSLDDIAWLFNIRGNDVECNPVVICYAAISMDETVLFVNSEKIGESERSALVKDKIMINDYRKIASYLGAIKSKKTVLIDPQKTSQFLLDSINIDAVIKEDMNITTKMKAVKNETEIMGMKNAHIRDGAAVVKFLHWLSNNIDRENVTEVSAAERLTAFRSEGEHYVGNSFGTIAGYGEHGAIIHYSADDKSDATLEKKGLFLLDSGGQYIDGTTDITRTVSLGEATEDEKRDFTLVLKGNIALSMVKFPDSVTGAHLDILARMALWKEGKNYGHGTGHGVGAFLNVHEGPQNISPGFNGVKIEDGMIMSNEPGFYKAGEYGIRTENLILAAVDEESEFGRFLKFETITICPVDRSLVVAEMLSDEERAWLNSYHRDVYEKLLPFMNEDEKIWLEKSTKSI